MNDARQVALPALGMRFQLHASFAQLEAGQGSSPAPVVPSHDDLPTAHFIASDPAAGWIAALAVVTVASEPAPPAEWLAAQLSRAEASFAQWSPAAHEMLVPPEVAELAGRPALHLRYRLTGAEPEGAATGSGGAPPSLVEHWTVLVAERGWLLALELMVQPPERWDTERDALELPFRTLQLA